jgi:Nif-specific regulatory protein
MLRRINAVVAIDRLQILLTGQSGSGKTLIARLLHENSARAARPFVCVNCAAVPGALWEAEFFGSVKSAYTQAADRGGRFAAAEGGVLLLDEVGEIPLEHQAKLLRVLDEGCYERLGEDRTRIADVRVIAATNRDLEQAVADGRFRMDLYFRLNRYHIPVPSLAERREDIAELALVLVERQCKALELPVMTISAAAVRVLEARPWPGNVRELESVLEQAVVEALADDEREVQPHHLRGHEALGPEVWDRAGGASAAQPQTLAEAVRNFQRHRVMTALDHANWNVTRAAQDLAISRSHLYNLMKVLGIPGLTSGPRQLEDAAATDAG